MTSHTLKYLLLILTAVVALTGCVSKTIYKDAAESGWQRWEQDHKPVVSDDEFSEMSEEDQANHMSATKEAARKFERDEALNLLTD